MHDGPFRQRLKREFESRRAANARYSLRAFARFLGTDHATLSQVLRGKRNVPRLRIRGWCERLGMGPEETAVYCGATHPPDHRMAEALNIIGEPVHWQIIQLCNSAEFRADSRWIAARAGRSTDFVNLAVTRLLRLGLLEMRDPARWSTVSAASEREFRATALARVNTHG